jgi:polyisoprenoid-binding protein YceI
MRMRNVPVLFLLAAALVLPRPALAQNAPQLKLLPESRVWVDGTSSRDSWTVKAAEVDGFVALAPTPGELRIQRGRFSVPSGTLTGDRGAIMDRLTQNALKSREHPTIVYELASATATPNGANKFNLQTRGRVTIAGVSKEITGAAEAERLPNGTLRFTGKYPLLMSDFGMTPPTAMFGQLRTGDEVVVNYELLVRP